jgi:hypothetical protein
LILFAGACSAALLVAGCGGGGGSTTITMSSIGKVQFVREADAICVKGSHQVEDAASEYLREHPKALQGKEELDFDKLVQTILVPAVEQELEELRALGAPKGDQGQVEAILVAVEEGREKSEEDPKPAVVGGSKAFVKANELAKEYGLELCAVR